jgi:protocatechuate 3,4-dioxygenase, alpha subunit
MTKLVPTGSQTVGPFFQIGLQYMMDAQAEREAASGTIELRGKVVDRDGMAVPDALLEFWSADRAESFAAIAPQGNGIPAVFCRTATDIEGRYAARVTRPGPVPFGDGTFQAPHLAVLVFARGLLRHLVTRVYFPGELDNDHDAVLQQVPIERRHTLIARLDPAGSGTFCWNVVLQGADETAFFAW